MKVFKQKNVRNVAVVLLPFIQKKHAQLAPSIEEATYHFSAYFLGMDAIFYQIHETLWRKKKVKR